MSVPNQNQLAEAIRRGRLTAEEEAQLREHLFRHPEERASWEDELSLNHCLRQIPDAPVSSNFTARVVQRALQENRERPSRARRVWRWLVVEHWLPKAATLAAVLCLGGLGYHQHQLTTRREVAQTLARMAVTGNSLELLRNFDAIQGLTVVPRDVDRELIAALQ